MAHGDHRPWSSSFSALALCLVPAAMAVGCSSGDSSAAPTTPIGGSRDLYGDPASDVTPSWGDVDTGFVVRLSTWPVTGTDPDSAARHSLDCEVEIERSDGPVATGYASSADSEFFGFVVWQEAGSWHALSRPVAERPEALADLAATARVANADELERVMLLREE